MSADKFPNIFSRQMEAIVYIVEFPGASVSKQEIDNDLVLREVSF